MKTFWKRTGWSAMSFLPVLISIILQLMLGVVLSVIISVIGVAQFGASIYESTEAMNEYVAFVAEESTKYVGAVIFFYHLIAMAGFGLWYYFGCGRPKAVNPLKVFKVKSFLCTLVLGFGLCLLANAFVFIAQYVAPDAVEAYMELMESAGIGVDAFAILASILLAPIGEEILCRGLCFHYAKKAFCDMSNRRAAFWIANAIQALGFGIMHMNLIQGLYAFILGLGLGWLRERYNSLYPAMLAHFVINFSSTYIVGYILEPIPDSLPASILLMAVSIGVCVLGVIIGKEKAEANNQAAA